MRRVPADPRFAADTAALVLKVGRYPLHHGGVAVVRTLGRAGVRVFGIHEDRGVPAARSAYLTGGFVWPTAGQDDHPRQLLAGIGDVLARIGRPCVVIPTDDHGAVFLNEHAGRLPGLLRQPALPPGMARQLVNKKLCRDLALRAGFPVPAATVVRCPASVSGLGRVEFPVVVKRAERALGEDGHRTYSTVIARGADELRRLVEAPGQEHDVLLQEVIPGDPGDDWLFHAYCDAGSNSLVSFTGRKLRSRPPYAGETAYAVAEDNPPLREQMEHLLKAIGFVGIVSMDLRYDRRDGTYRLLDFNPRTGACFRLFENAEGIDVVRALHLDLSGRPVPRGPQRDGRTYQVEPYDLQVRGTYVRAGLSLRRWLTSVACARERAWLSSDDLVPAAVYAIRRCLPRQEGPPAPAPEFFAGRRKP
jgi:predicted ATP-grasp superfamily ATP-dependent carboligase